MNTLGSNLQNNISINTEFSTHFPPSSLHSFRRILKNETESAALPEVLITDHNAEFTNLFYNSALDGFDKIDFEYRNITVDGNGTCEYILYKYLNTIQSHKLFLLFMEIELATRYAVACCRLAV